MLKAMFDTYTTNVSAFDEELPFDLAGEWRPVRHAEWYNRLPGKHSKRARDSSTKMVYESDGSGSGWVGEVYVVVQARSIAPGRYTAKFRVKRSTKTIAWSATDGHLTLLDDGTLQVQYPSYGIIEYWKRTDGRGAQILREARERAAAKRVASPHTSKSNSTAHNTNGRTRNIRLLFRHFGNAAGFNNDGLLWHWGLSIGSSIYEVNGGMAVMGPNGVVAATSPFMTPVRTNMSRFHGFLDLPQHTGKTDEEIEEFSRRWVKLHPVYKVLGPNCQTYTEDLFTFVTGEDLPFSKTSDKVVGRSGNMTGPQDDPDAVWLDTSKKPPRS